MRGDGVTRNARARDMQIEKKEEAHPKKKELHLQGAASCSSVISNDNFAEKVSLLK